MKCFLLFIPIFFLGLFQSYGQENNNVIKGDTALTYKTDLSDYLALRTYLLLKINALEILRDGQKIRLAPNSPVALGFGFNYKGLGLGIGIGLPHSNQNISKYGKTTRFDMQMSLFTKRIGGDVYFQLYKGYFNSNPQDFMEWENDYFPQIPSLRTISFGFNGYYIFNHRKFSNKAAYVRTEIQQRSAGSFTLGYFLNYDEAESPTGFIPAEYPDSIGNDLDIKSFRYFATGLSLGYTYTWVISDHFYMNGAIIPGFGYKDTRLFNSGGESGTEQEPHVQLLLRGSIGYEHKSFYAGFSGLTLIRNIAYKDYNINLATEQLRFYVGKRFGYRGE